MCYSNEEIMKDRIQEEFYFSQSYEKKNDIGSKCL